MFSGMRGVLIVCLALGVATYMLGGPSVPSAPASAGRDHAAKFAMPPAPKAHKEGEPILVGYTGYAVWRSWWSSRLTADSFLNQAPNAKYLFVLLSVVNNDNKARDIPPFQLVDDQGAEYDSDTHSAMLSGAIGPLESLNPSVSKVGFVVFDVPPDKKYRLKLSGGYWSGESAFVKLEPAPKLPKNPTEKLERLLARRDKAKAIPEDKHD